MTLSFKNHNARYLCLRFFYFVKKSSKTLNHLFTGLLLSRVTLIFEHSSSRASEIEHFEIFSRPRENQLARRFFLKI